LISNSVRYFDVGWHYISVAPELGENFSRKG
jgi:hypothetical protein